jgi:hypothetical protein
MLMRWIISDIAIVANRIMKIVIIYLIPTNLSAYRAFSAQYNLQEQVSLP